MLPWLPTAIAFVMFLGAAAVYLRGSRDKGTIDTLTRSNAALTERVRILEDGRTTDQTRIGTLEQANQTLTNTVNSSELITSLTADVRELTAAVADHHVAAMRGMTQIHSDLAALPERLAVVLRRGTQ